MIVGNHRESTKVLLELEQVRSQDTKLMYKKSVTFAHTNNEHGQKSN